jgi:tripartite-type tricarboxylate transporter receptor subunit TctC
MRFRCLVASLILGLIPWSSSFADASYPDRPIRLVIPFSTGGSTDTFGRIIAEGMQADLGQPVVVENRPGAGGNIGAEVVARAKPDGYTLLLAQDSLTTVSWLYKKLSFDPFKDFSPIGIGVFMPMVLVASNTLPVSTVPELIEYAKQRPGKLTYGSPGIATAHHLNFEALLDRIGTKMVHVPYKGASGMNADLAAGNVDVAFTALSSALPLLATGRVKALAVAQEKPSPLLPGVPTIAQTLPGYEAQVWFGLSAPVGTPTAIIERLSASLRKVVSSEATLKRLLDNGYTVTPTTPAGMTEIMDRESRKWKDLISRLGVTLD